MATSQLSDIGPSNHDDSHPQFNADTSSEVASRQGADPNRVKLGAFPDPSAEASTDHSAHLFRGRHEFKRPSKVDTTRTKASASASVISFGDPYDSPSSPSPSLHYVAQSPVDLSPSVTPPPVASPPLSRPSSNASLGRPPSVGAGHVPKSPRTHWAQLRRAVLPEVPPLPSQAQPAEEATAATTAARTSTHTPSMYSLSQQVQQKYSRLARFGFRHQVAASETSQAAITDTELAKRFAIDLRGACRSVKVSGSGMDGGTVSSGGPGPSQILPTSTSHALEHQNSSNVNSGISSKIGLHRGLRHPPSLKSIVTQATKEVSLSHTGPHQVLSVLEQYSAMPGVSSALPGETEVLNTLFTPFLDHHASGRLAEDARLVALEAFDLIAIHWRSASPEVSR